MKEDGFILGSQDLPITMLLRVGVPKPTAQLGDRRHRPKQYRGRQPELGPDSPRRSAPTHQPTKSTTPPA